MTDSHVDILNIAGVEHTSFYASEDVTLVGEDKRPCARVFRRNGRIVYRAGTAIEWDGGDGHPVSSVDAFH